MKILLLNQTFFPDNASTSQHLTDLAKHLTEEGHEVSVISDRRAYDDRTKFFPRRENVHGIQIHRLFSTGFGKKHLFGRICDAISFEVFLMFKLVFFPRQDLVIALTTPPLIGLFGLLFRCIKGGRLVQWLMDINVETAKEVGYLTRGSLIERMVTGLFQFLLKHSDCLIVLDRWMKKRIVEMGVEDKKIIVIPPWPAHTSESVVVPTEAGKSLFRKTYGLQQKFVVLYAGNHSLIHPLETLLEAARLLKEDPTVVFLFVGVGVRVHDVTRYIKEHKLKNVVQLGRQPREMLGDILESADLHVVVMGESVSGLAHTSKIYGILESGKPFVFVGPRQSHVVDVLESGCYGFHVSHGESHKLVECVREVHALSREKLAECRIKNKNYVITHFRLPHLLREFSERFLAPLHAKKVAA